ncbi:deoxynucleotide monophosphate kinase family protein [Streptomyces sp. NPDC001205]
MTMRAEHPKFAAWVTEAAAKAGFPVDVPRSGGLQQLAEAIGTAESTVHRVIMGERVPAVRFWPAWVAALEVEAEEFKRHAVDARRAAKATRLRASGPRLLNGGLSRPLVAPRLIGLSGAARAGKDELGRALVERGWQRKAFADKVRDFLYQINPWLPDDEINGSYQLADEVDRYGWEQVKEGHPAVREALQRCGTEAGRHVLGPDVWVNALFQDEQDWDAPVVITDVRFPNEAQAIKDRGGLVVEVRRPKQILINGADHISENALKDWDFDVIVLNTGTIEDLHKSATCLLSTRM